MNDTIIYRPHKSERRLIPIAMFFGIFYFVLLGGAIVQIGFSAKLIGPFVLLLTGGAFLGWLTISYYSLSNIVVFFERDGLRIARGRHENYKYFRWDEFSYAYYALNSRGHFFLILSPSALDEKEAKKFAKRGSISMGSSLDDVAVIHIDPFQNTEHIKEFIAGKVLQVHTYSY